MYTNKSIKWEQDWNVFCSFEFPLKELENQLPENIFPLEIRPQIGLISVGAISFKAGNLNGTLPAFKEIDFNIMVRPNLSIDMPMPRFAFYTVAIASDCEEFLNHAGKVDKMPLFFAKHLKVELDDQGLFCYAKDDDGDIFSIRNSVPMTAYRKNPFWGQYFTFPDGEEEYFGCFRWEGEMYEHQDSKLVTAEFFKHPFFSSLNLNDRSLKCYLEMISKSSHQNIEFYESIKFNQLFENFL